MCPMSEQIVNANGAAFHVTEGGVAEPTLFQKDFARTLHVTWKNAVSAHQPDR
jgi:hypothetical protein